MPETRSRRRTAATPEPAPAAAPPPKRKTADKPLKSKGGSKKPKAGKQPPSGASPIPSVGATPAADVPPSLTEDEDLEVDPTAEAQPESPPKPLTTNSDDELQDQDPELFLVEVVAPDHGVEVGNSVDAETARCVQDQCPELVITTSEGHVVIARLAAALAFAASSVPAVHDARHREAAGFLK